MCLIAMAIDQSQRFPLVIAANRDEYFVRPTARLTGGRPKAVALPFWAGATFKPEAPGWV